MWQGQNLQGTKLHRPGGLSGVAVQGRVITLRHASQAGALGGTLRPRTNTVYLPEGPESLGNLRKHFYTKMSVKKICYRAEYVSYMRISRRLQRGVPVTAAPG